MLAGRGPSATSDSTIFTAALTPSITGTRSSRVSSCAGRHPAAAKNNRPAAILFQSANAALTHFLLRRATAVFQRQHRQVNGVQRRAVLMKSVLVQQMTGDDQRARQRGHNGETGGDHRRHMHCRLRDTDHRPRASSAPPATPGRRSRRSHAHPPLLASGPDLQHADRRDGFVKVALN